MSRSMRCFRLILLLSLPCFATAARAQITNVTNQTSTPIQGAGHDYIKMLNETVNPANGSVSLRIQAPTPPGRKTSLPFSFAYDSGGAKHLLNIGPLGKVSWADNYGYLARGGWSYTVPMLSVSFIKEKVLPKGGCDYFSFFVFQDGTGGLHHLGLAIYDGSTAAQCDNAIPNPAEQVFSGGDDYYRAALTTISAPLLVADAEGTVYSIPYSSFAHSSFNGAYSDLPTSIEDRNGNVINVTDNGNGAISVKDTLGRTMLSTSSFESGTDTIAVSGLTNSYAATWGSASANHAVGTSLVWSDGIGCPIIPALSGSTSVINQITLPNNTSYVFSYDSNYGLLNKITYPSGGFISYTWKMNSLSEFISLADQNGNLNSCFWQYDVPVVATRSVSFDGVNIALQQTFSYSTTWASGGTTWTSKTTTVTTIDNVTGLTYTTTYTYSPYTAPSDPNDWSQYPPQIPLEQSVVTKNSAGTPIRTVTKSWFDQYELQSEKTTLEDGATSSQTTYTYGAGAQVTSKSDYDYPSGTALIRKTVTNYQTFNATPIYPGAASIFDRPCQSIVYDSSGSNRVAETDYLYDGGSSVCGAAGTPSVASVSNLPTGTHDETNYGPASASARGNLTKVIELCLQSAPACSGGNPTTTSTYDETGEALTFQDPNNNITNYSYADSYTVLSGGANTGYTPSGNTNAFLTKVTDPLGHTQNFTYDFNNGQLTVSKDQNALTTTYLYNDPFARPTLTTRPDNGTTSVAYNDSPYNASTPSPSATTTQKINSSASLVTVSAMDGLGHAVTHLVTSDPQGTIHTDTTYSGLGAVYTVSNPYRSGSDPTTSSGTTTYFYDALGRKCLEVPPDGTQPTGGACPATQPANDLFTTYSLNTTTVTDQTGKSRKSAADGLGRLTQVFEDPAGLNYETDYAYDPLNNLLSVNQKGGSTNSSLWRTRTFAYDSLSRLLTSNNPEVGTIAYKYDSDSNCAGPYSFIGLLVSKTDARGIRTCAQYDAINREVALSYSNGDPAVTTTYDQAACLGLSSCQNIGHRTSMTDAAGSDAWSYQVDANNNRSVHAEQRTTNGITKTSTYYLDQAGNVTQAVYPTGRVVNYAYDAANRPVSAVDGSNGITYATDFQTAPTGCLTGKVCYTPQGTFYALSIGQTSSFTGLNLTHTYNSRLQPNEFKASSTGGNAIDITYSFVDSATTHNAGHVNSITNNLDTTRSQSFTYDSLNRITSALTASTYASSPAHCWGETYGVDAWGNLQSIAATTNSNYTGCSEESGFSAPADGYNHLPGFSYDASGNTQSDGTISYTWNGESQLITAAGITYIYDGDGRRVTKVGSKLYWYGSGDDILAETDASGNTLSEYVFFGGKRIAMISSSGGNSLPIQNASFETFNPWTYQGCGGTCAWNGGPIPGWTNGGSFEPGSTYYNLPLPNGNVVAWSNGGGISQTLTGIGLQPNTTYTLSVYVGHRLDGDATTYSIALLAGSTVLNSVNGSNSNIPLGEFAQVTLTYTTGSTVTPGDLSIQLTSTAAQTDFDNVTLTSGTAIYYYVEDLLGTSRVITTNTGVVCYDGDFYPFGGERTYTDTCPQNYKFEGKERDTETGNDDFGARYYSNRFGRWLSADWSAVPVPVPYANLTNPQTLNLYSMVSDDPESFADLDGHQEPTPREEKDPKEEAREEAELREILDRLQEKMEEREAREALDIAEAHQRFVNEQGGYDDPFTGVCYAPGANVGRPTIGPSRPEPPQLAEGKEAHKNEPVRPGEKPEVRTPSGKRMDRYNESEGHIRELKPNNPRQIKRGQKQLEGYKKEMDAAKKRDHTTELNLYNRTPHPGPKPPTPKPNPNQ